MTEPEIAAIEQRTAEASAAYWRSWLSWAHMIITTLRYLVPLLAAGAAAQFYQGTQNLWWWLACAIVAWLAHVDLTRRGVVDYATELHNAWVDLAARCRGFEPVASNRLTVAELVIIRVDLQQRESAYPVLPWLVHTVRIEEPPR